MEIDKAIETMKYNRHLLGLPNGQGNTWKANANTIACDMAIAALERQREKENKIENGWMICSKCGQKMYRVFEKQEG